MDFVKKVYRWFKRSDKSVVEQYLETFIIILPIAFIIRTFGYGLYQVPTGSMETTMLVGERFLADKFTVWFRPIKHGDIITFNAPDYPYSDNKLMRLWQNYVWGPANWTKRVIAIPGDHIKGSVEDGRPVLYLNGQKLDEPYVNKYPLISLFQPTSTSGWQYRSYNPDFSYEQQPFYRMTSQEVELGKRVAQRFGEEDMRQSYTVNRNEHNTIVDEYEFTLGDNQYWVLGDNRKGSQDARYWGHPLDGSLIHGKIIFRLWSLDSYESWWIWDLLQHPIDFWTRVRWNRFFQVVR